MSTHFQISVIGLELTITEIIRGSCFSFSPKRNANSDLDQERDVLNFSEPSLVQNT